MIPGPWNVVKRQGLLCVEAPSRQVAAGVFGEDNARLIAAAPDLLEALGNLVDALEHPVRYRRQVEAALAVIGKATGEEP